MSQPEFKLSAKPLQTYSKLKVKPAPTPTTFTQFLREDETSFVDWLELQESDPSRSGEFPGTS